MRLIAIYKDDESETLSHIVSTMEEASEWIGVSRRALYYSLHVNGVMKARGYFIGFLNLEEDDQ